MDRSPRASAGAASWTASSGDPSFRDAPTSLIRDAWAQWVVNRALVLLALPGLLAGCLGGEPAVPMATGQIDGAVVNHLLAPFANQEVRLVQLDRNDFTSLLGGFTFRDVPVGLYTVTTTSPLGGTATQIVDVEADRVTRVILQILPPHEAIPYFEAHSFQSFQERPQAGTDCAPCEWAVPLDSSRPTEITFDALWHPGPVVGEERDLLDIEITDGRGFALFNGHDLETPLQISIDGADLHAEATEIRVRVAFGENFMPSMAFRMDNVLTFYHGATKAQMFEI